MLPLLVAAALFVAALIYWRQRVRAARSRGAPNNAIAQLTAAALGRLLAKVGTIDRAGEAVPASASIFVMVGDNLLVADGVSVGADDIVDAAVDYAASQTRSHTSGPPTDALVGQWLEQGVCKAIARYVQGSMERMQRRLTIMARTPRPSPAEIDELRRENERERAEMTRLVGDAGSATVLPTAIVERN